MPRRIFPHERPDLYGTIYNERLDSHLRDWRRRRAVLVAGGKSEPHDVSPDWQQRVAKSLGEPPPTGAQSDHDIVKWHYWRDTIGILETLARLTRLGAPLASWISPVPGISPVEGTLNEREARDTLADLLSVQADLLKGQLQGKLPPAPSGKPRKRTGRSRLAPRRADAATLALAVAQLQREAGSFETFTEAETAASKEFGLERGGLESRSTPAKREKAADVLREKMRLTVKPEDQATWLAGMIREAVQQDKETDITP